jgi:hypothetical protein
VARATSLDAPAGLLELGLQLVGLVALDALADDLDHLDLLVARGGEH